MLFEIAEIEQNRRRVDKCSDSTRDINMFWRRTRTPASAGVPLRRGLGRTRNCAATRTPASAGVPLRLDYRDSLRLSLSSHPCFGGGSTETHVLRSYKRLARTRTPASAGVPLRLLGSPQGSRRPWARTPASAGVPLRHNLNKHNRSYDCSHPCFGGGSTETWQVFGVVGRVHLAPLLRRGFH